jgi:hypothetical protein
MTLETVMLSVIYAECGQSALCADCHYAECLYAECLYAECLYAECLYAECHYAKMSRHFSANNNAKNLSLCKKGATRFSKPTLIIMTLSITTLIKMAPYIECCYAECHK